MRSRSATEGNAFVTEWRKNGLRSAQGDACVEQRSKKGQQALSPGQRPGYKDVGKFALKGQKPYLANDAFALSGRWLRLPLPRAMPWACSLLPLRGAIT